MLFLGTNLTAWLTVMNIIYTIVDLQWNLDAHPHTQTQWDLDTHTHRSPNLPPARFWSRNSEAGSTMSNWIGVPGAIRSSGSGATEVFWEAPAETTTPPGFALSTGQADGQREREQEEMNLNKLRSSSTHFLSGQSISKKIKTWKAFQPIYPAWLC